MASISKDDVLSALKRIAAPDGRGSIVSAGIVSEIAIDGGTVMFALQAEASHARAFEPVRQAAEKAVLLIPGVSKAIVALTAERGAGALAPREPGPKAAAAATLKNGIPGIKHMIAVASGKGGVGKSTTAVNLALGLQTLGLRVGILDADVYGPSMPRLLGISGKPKAADSGGKMMMPMEAYGLKVMSIGFLVGEDTPMIWRGPMVMSALMQMLRDVAWGDIDIMVVDMPPGTGDAQLTMAQQTPLAGAVIVSTPQDLALIDARKGLNMFKRVNVPVLGIVENMSYFMCGKCGERHEIFGHGGARAEAVKLGAPFLGEVPLDAQLRALSDAGHPVVAADPHGPHAAIYRDIARQVWVQVARGEGLKPAPRIVIEG
jgi:ATP-binding protein involved in chromosome partitioning